MTLSLLANPILRPYLTQLIPLCPNQTEIVYLSEDPIQRGSQIARHLQSAIGYDAIVLLDGTDTIPEEGWTVGTVPLIMPRVHNVAGLLLGGDTAYRKLFYRYNGGICWMFPGAQRELHAGHPADCQVLCLLADTQLELPDASLYSRMISRYNGWDFQQASTDLSLLESLICGGCDCSDYLHIASGNRIFPISHVENVV